MDDVLDTVVDYMRRAFPNSEVDPQWIAETRAYLDEQVDGEPKRHQFRRTEGARD